MGGSNSEITISIILGSLFVFALLCGIIISTTRKSFKSGGKQNSPKLWLLFVIAFLQILLGVIIVLAVKGINNNPIIASDPAWGAYSIRLLLDKNLSQTELEAISAFMVVCSRYAIGPPAGLCCGRVHHLVNADIHIIPSPVMIRVI